MAEVPDLNDFKQLAAQVAELQAERDFFKSLLLGERWLTRVQAMNAIGCKDSKLRALTLNQTFKPRYEGKSPFYDVYEVRTYLTGLKIEQKEVDRRVLSARFGYQ